MVIYFWYGVCVLCIVGVGKGLGGFLVCFSEFYWGFVCLISFMGGVEVMRGILRLF